MSSPKTKTQKTKPKISKKRLVSYLLEHDINLQFSAKELSHLPVNILLSEKVHVQTDKDNERLRSSQELTAIEFILSQPDNFFSRKDLEAMCQQDLLAEEKWLQEKTRQAAKRSIFITR